MKIIQLKRWDTGAVLYEGQFDSHKACLQAAIRENANLNAVLLENMDLRHANLDGAYMNEARVQGCDLFGANLSESELAHSVWTGCNVTEVCFKDSNLISAQFKQCRMIGLNIHFADIRGVMVSSPDFLKSDFSQTLHMGGAVFMGHGTAYPMSRPPEYVRGLPVDIVLLDEHIVLGDLMVLRHDQIAMTRHCLMDIANDGASVEPVLQSLWNALRVRPLHNDRQVA